MAAVASPWGKPGAWALDSEEYDAQILKEQQEQQIKQTELGLDFPSLNDAIATKQKKKPQTLSLAAFNATATSRSSSQDRTHDDLIVLPTGPCQRTAEELDRNKLGGGFRNYGSNGSYERSNNRYANGDDSSNSKWGSSRVSDENRRINNGSGDSGRDFTPSRADEVDNWALTKKSIVGNGFERRDRGLGFSDSQSSKADESDSWVSNKINVQPDGRRFERARRGRGFTMNGIGGADSETWGRKKDEGNVNAGSIIGSRPKLNLQPRTLPVDDGKSSEARSKSLNPFGEARPREEVLAEKGHDWKKIEEEKTEKFNDIGKKSFGNGTSRAYEDRTERSWRKPESPPSESHPDSAEENENGHGEGDGEQVENANENENEA